MVLVGPIEDAAFQALQSYTGSIVARSIVNGAKASAGITGEYVSAGELTVLLNAVENGTRAFLADTTKADECVTATRASVTTITGVSVDGLGAGMSSSPSNAAPMPFGASAGSGGAAAGGAGSRYGGTFGTANMPFGGAAAPVEIASRRVDILEEFDIVNARGETKKMCMDLGFPALEQVKIATVVSELARNIVQYAGTGFIEMRAVMIPKRGIEITAKDNGKGIPDIDHVLSGSYNSTTGMGVGLVGTKRLMDEFEVETGPTGTQITAKRYIP